MADKKTTKNKTDLTSNATTPEVVAPLNRAAARSFNVLKDYDGIKKSDVVFNNDTSTISYMLQQGYWKEV